MSQHRDTYDAANPYAAPRPEMPTPSAPVDIQDDDSCTVSYELTLDDYVAALLHQQRWTRKVIGAAIFFVFFAVIGGLLWYIEGPGLLVFLMLVFAVNMVFQAGPWYYTQRAKTTRRILAQNIEAESLGPMQISLSADGSDTIESHARLIRDWPSIRRVEVTDQYVYLWGAKTILTIIPRRCFLNQEAFERFVAIAKRHVGTTTAVGERVERSA